MMSEKKSPRNRFIQTISKIHWDMTWYYDSHIHLSDPEYTPYLDTILNSMASMKIKACCVSMDNNNSLQSLELAKKSESVLPFIGIHPECASDDLEQMITLIDENHSTVSGIGEIGLDPTYTNNEDDTKRQKQVFQTLLELAEKYEKPVSIHSRKSLDDVLETMSSYKTEHALLHWFDGNKKQLRRAMDMGFFVSYGPVTVYANDKQSLLSRTDQSKILVETDGPVRFSRCFESKSGQLGFIPSVVFCVSKILDISFDDTVYLLENNSKSYLGI